MKSGLWDLVNALQLSGDHLRNIKENCSGLFLYVTFRRQVYIWPGAEPMLGAAARGLSSVCGEQRAAAEFFKGQNRRRRGRRKIKETTRPRRRRKGETNMQRPFTVRGDVLRALHRPGGKSLRGVPGVAEVTADLEKALPLP